MLKQLSNWKEKAEAIAGMFAVFFIGFVPVVLGLLLGLAALVNEENARSQPAWLCFPVMLVTGVLAVWLARMAQRALYTCYPEFQKLDQAALSREKPVLSLAPTGEPVEHSERPMAVVLALNLPRIPIVAAIPLALYWLAHAGSGVAIGFGLDLWVESAFPQAHAWVKYLVPQVLNFGFSFASNIYLLLAAGLFVRQPSTLERLWSLRIVIDLILTAITAVPAALEWAKLGRP